jgi:hypothetical protein
MLDNEKKRHPKLEAAEMRFLKYVRDAQDWITLRTKI